MFVIKFITERFYIIIIIILIKIIIIEKNNVCRGKKNAG